MTEERIYSMGLPLRSYEMVLRGLGYDPSVVRRVSRVEHLQGLRGGVLLAGPFADLVLVGFARDSRGMEIRWID